jgi:anti-sigma regulatory factor (Ser/Thr protein kinase)
MTEKNKIVIELPGSFEYIRLVIKSVENISSILKLDQEVVNELVISLVEACNNSIEHGYECSGKGRVNIQIIFDTQKIEFIVRDWGKGFEFSGIKEYNPDDPEELFNYRGRGIFMMKRFMNTFDCIKCPDGGMQIKMTKILRPG